MRRRAPPGCPGRCRSRDCAQSSRRTSSASCRRSVRVTARRRRAPCSASPITRLARTATSLRRTVRRPPALPACTARRAARLHPPATRRATRHAMRRARCAAARATWPRGAACCVGSGRVLPHFVPRLLHRRGVRPGTARRAGAGPQAPRRTGCQLHDLGDERAVPRGHGAPRSTRGSRRAGRGRQERGGGAAWCGRGGGGEVGRLQGGLWSGWRGGWYAAAGCKWGVQRPATPSATPSATPFATPFAACRQARALLPDYNVLDAARPLLTAHKRLPAPVFRVALPLIFSFKKMCDKFEGRGEK